jgi:hypothetical protein
MDPAVQRPFGRDRLKCVAMCQGFGRELSAATKMYRERNRAVRLAVEASMDYLRQDA